MYIKLTRLDGNPIWINAAFVVTIEPRLKGGSTVVPVGDGLDYDVRETPEEVLRMLEGTPVPTVVTLPVPEPKSEPAPEPAPAPAVIPVPTTDALTKTPEDVSAEPLVMTREHADDLAKVSDEPKPAKRATRSRTKKAATTADGAAAPAKKRTTRTKAKAAAVRPLTEEQVEKLKKMAPGSVKKLGNTLSSQFGVADAESAVKWLAENGVVALDRDHVDWK